jgi:hypothetical protein
LVMSNSEEQEREAEWAEFEKHRSRFFALIGHCITIFQSVEDYLPNVFAVALGINEAKALKIFNLTRGLDIRLAMISEALSDAADEHKQRWEALLKRIRAAAEARNQIAHANPVHHGGRITVEIGEGFQVKSVKRTGSGRMELHKQTQNSKAIWTTELLITEYNRASELSGHLIAFVKRLKGESVPAHLEEAFEPESQKGKKTKPDRRAKPK